MEGDDSNRREAVLSGNRRGRYCSEIWCVLKEEEIFDIVRFRGALEKLG
jgi:hypothetical protein